MTRYLSADDVIVINAEQCGPGAGIRDRSVLDGALGRASQTFGGADLLPSIWQKAATILHGIAATQAFFDGNKRTAWAAAEAFLNINGIDLGEIVDVEAEAFIRAVGADLLTQDAIAEWVNAAAARAADRAYPRLGGPSAITQDVHIEGGTFRIADFVNSGTNIRGLTATGVHFVGPAVVVLTSTTTLHGSTLKAEGGGPEALVWEIDAARNLVIGGIGLIDCTFTDCTFTAVGFAMPAEHAHLFFEEAQVRP